MQKVVKVWLIGRKGRLGSAIESLISKEEFYLVTTDEHDVDIEDLDQVLNFASSIKADIIINAASKSNRLWCEENEEAAFRLHALGARNLAIAANDLDAHLIHLSSDFVFDGKATEGYTEFDQENPQTIYGKSKLAGEMLVRSLCNKHTILRSSWLYGKKYLNEIIKEARETGKVKISKQIVGSPTSNLEFAEKVLDFLSSLEYGTFHISSEGECTYEEFVRELLDTLNIKYEIVDSDTQSSFEYSRPVYSVLDNYMLRLIDIENMSHWRDALHRFIKERKVG